MTTATAPTISRGVLQDRWDGVMEWSRTGGNPSDEYLALVTALRLVIDEIERKGIAR